MLTPYNLVHLASLVKSTVSINPLFHNALEFKYFLNRVCSRTPNQRLRAIMSRYLAIKNLSILAGDAQLNLTAFDRVTEFSNRHLRKAWEVV